MVLCARVSGRLRAEAPDRIRTTPGGDNAIRGARASSIPRQNPCCSSASMAYAEHDGSKRQAPPVKGLSSNW